ncbi:MAG TPA: thiol reductant ABC exporter subunit CydD [Solirubrobacteraceae bacterium]|jgi:ATP-binding cassette subfamily C protein CydCD|nr:thiol reductant ABC exporter subunit CydD [Solirubrobacteraceae bacterium]
MPAPVDRRLLRESRAARAQLLLAGVLGVAMAVTVVAQAALLAYVIASAAVHRTALGLAETGMPAKGLRPPVSVAGALAALAAVVVARALLAGAFEVSGRVGATHVMSELRGRLAEQLLVRSPIGRSGDRTGELAAAAVQGVDALETYFAGYLPQLVLAAAVPGAILLWLAPVDAIAAGVLALTIPLLIVFMILVGKGAQARARGRWRALAQLSGHFLDVVRGLPTLRAFRREIAQAQTLERVGERYRAETMGTLRVAFLSALVLELCAMIGTALVAVTIGLQLDGGHLALQAGLTVLLLAPELYGPLRTVGQQFHASTDGMAAAERIFAVLDAPATLIGGVEVALAGGAKGAPAAGAEAAGPVPATSGVNQAPDPAAEPLRFEDVSYSYPDRSQQALDGLDLGLAPGRITALVGATGAGKSTVAALALRLADPTSGRVSCGGRDLREIAPVQWRQRIAWVPQRTRLFNGTLAENIALAVPNAPRQRILAVARDAGLDELLAQLPDGLNTRVGEGGRGLSAGQAQRVGLARAFVCDARLLVLDEPTAHLDADTAAAVGAAVERLAEGRTTLLVTHDARLVGIADEVVTLAAGRAVATPLGALA